MEYIRLTVPSYFQNRSLHDFLHEMCISSKRITSLENGNEILVNGESMPFTSLLNENDELSFQVNKSDELDFAPSIEEAKIVYEDDLVFIVEKPAGMIMYGEDFQDHKTLANQVAKTLTNRSQNLKVRHLHRLDLDTTGLVMYAKHFISHAYYSTNWDKGIVLRSYLAIIEGTLSKSKGVIDLPIGKDRHKNNHYLVLASGKKAITRYEVQKTFSDSALISLTLDTGRTHQIRVHLGYLKHPLVYDSAYGAVLKAERVFLHSHNLTFFHPLKREYLTVISPLPEDMTRFIEKRGFYEY